MNTYKVGDFVLFNDEVYNEHGIITNVYLDMCDCLIIETLNKKSKPFLNKEQVYTFKVLNLVTDEKIINRLNKIMVFK